MTTPSWYTKTSTLKWPKISDAFLSVCSISFLTMYRRCLRLYCALTTGVCLFSAVFLSSIWNCSLWVLYCVVCPFVRSIQAACVQMPSRPSFPTEHIAPPLRFKLCFWMKSHWNLQQVIWGREFVDLECDSVQPVADKLPRFLVAGALAVSINF